VSIVIPTLNEGKNLRKTIQSLQETTRCDYEIIIVDNGSTDGCSDFIMTEINDPRIRLFKTDRLGPAKARNFGAGEARGDFIIFADAHVLFPDGWISPLIKCLDTPDSAIGAPALGVWGNGTAKGYGFRWRNAYLDIEWLSQKMADAYPVPMVGSGCMAVKKDSFDEIGGFDSGMVNYGCEDAEICIRTWLLGYKIFIVPQIEVSHYFRAKHPYEVRWCDVIHNALRTAISHFDEDRLDKVLNALKTQPEYEEAYSLVNGGDIWEKRKILFGQRKYDENWFFRKFKIPF